MNATSDLSMIDAVGAPPPDGPTPPANRSAWTALDWFDESCRLDDLRLPLDAVVAAADAGFAIARAAADDALILEGALRLAVAYSDRGYVARAVHVMAEEMKSVQRCTDRSLVAGFLAVYAAHLCDAGELLGALRHHEEAVAALVPDDVVNSYRVHINYLITLVSLDRTRDAGALAAIVRGLQKRLPDDGLREYRICHSSAILAIVAADMAAAGLDDGGTLDRALLADALLIADKAVDLARSATPSLLDLAIIGRALCRMLLGQPDPEGEAYAAAAPPGALAGGSVLTIHAVVRWASVVVRLRSDLALARRILDLTDPRFAPDKHSAPQLHWFVATADLYERSDELAAACAEYRRQIAATRRYEAMILSVRSEIADAIAQAEATRQQVRRAQEREQALQLRNTELNADQVRLTEAAHTDALTRIGNRRAFDLLVESLSDRPVHSVVVIDIDHFKQVNDRHSHQIGDRVIAAIAAVLGRAIRSTDRFFRYGGEEFAVICQGRLKPGRVDKWRRAVEHHAWTSLADGLAVTASFGVSSWQPDEPFEAAFSRADERLYRAKATGRNRVVAK